MKKDISRMVKKTMKIAGVSCLALGAAALVASGAAAKALAEGVKYVRGRVKHILNEEPAADETVEEVAEAAEVPAAGEMPRAETVETE